MRVAHGAVMCNIYRKSRLGGLLLIIWTVASIVFLPELVEVLAFSY